MARRRARIRVRDEPIKFRSELQLNWPALIPPLRQGQFLIESTDTLAIHGDAPKDFVKIREYTGGKPTGDPATWPAWIAKVGSKDYPIESITEHLLTRVGQTLGVHVADSQLRIVGRQVRFLSRYFLESTTESLVHGIELFKRHLDEELVEEIANARAEQDFYTFQTVCAAVKEAFPSEHEQLIADFVEMLAFDAITGQNDRHPANWGVIVPVMQTGTPRYSPVYDSARALFWNLKERQLGKYLTDQQAFHAYIRKSRPQIGWDGTAKIDHFGLIRNIWRDFPQYRPYLSRFSDPSLVDNCGRVIEDEFAVLMTETRRRVIIHCLAERMSQFIQAQA